MSAPRAMVVFTGESDLHPIMKDLIDFLVEKNNLDYIILDSASGIRDAYTLSFHSCDEIIVLFRWSDQHIEGTIRFIRLIEMMKEMGETSRPYKLVASAVPGEEELEKLDDRVLARNLEAAKEENQKLLIDELGEEGNLFYEIPEIIELKWHESVIVFDRENTPYEEVARKLLIL